MHTQTVGKSPLNRRGGQESYLLLAAGQFGSQRLAMTWVEGAPGSEQALHEHADNEQVYVVVRGHGLMKCGGEEQEVGPGTLIYVPPRTQHAIRNTGDEPLVFISATSPPFQAANLGEGFAYQPQGRP